VKVVTVFVEAQLSQIHEAVKFTTNKSINLNAIFLSPANL